MPKPKYWVGSKITNCDLCKAELTDTFYDAQVYRAGWAILCPKCFSEVGVGLGEGKGQKFEKKWLLTEGGMKL